MRNTLFITIILAQCLSGKAQDIIYKTYDLATLGAQTEPIEAGRPIQLKFINLLPNTRYTIVSERTSEVIPPFQLPNVVRANTGCSVIIDAIEDFDNATSEIHIGPLVRILSRLIPNISCVTESELANDVIERTTRIVNIPPLRKGENINIVVERLIDGNVVKSSLTLKTGSRGEWRTFFGYAVIPTIFSKEERHYLDTANIIRIENDQKRLHYLPGIFFTWLPEEYALKNWSWSWTAGLGVNFSLEPVIYFGRSGVYNHNVALTCGLVAYRQYFLKGRYSIGQKIHEENFDEEDGLHQKRIRVNPFISLSFRLGENPFKPNE